MQNDFYAAKQENTNEVVIPDGVENTELNANSQGISPNSASMEAQEETNWEERARDLEHRFKTHEGMLKRADKDKRALSAQIEEYRAKEQEWEKRFSELENKLTTKQILAPVDEEEEIKFTPEEEAEFAPATPYLKKLARLEAKQLFKKYVEPLTQEIGVLKDSSKNLATSLASTDENTFRTIIKLNIPNHDQLVADDNFQNYLNQRESPRVKFTTRDVVRNAFAERDLQTIVQVFKDFNQSNQQASNGLASMTAPVMNGVGSNTVRANSNKFPKSKFFKAGEALDRGDMKPEVFLKIKSEYDKAKAAGLVDENS